MTQEEFVAVTDAAIRLAGDGLTPEIRSLIVIEMIRHCRVQMPSEIAEQQRLMQQSYPYALNTGGGGSATGRGSYGPLAPMDPR